MTTPNLQPGDHYSATDLHADGSSDTSNIELGYDGSSSDTQGHVDSFGNKDAFEVSHDAQGNTSYTMGSVEADGEFHVSQHEVDASGNTVDTFEAHGSDIHDLTGGAEHS